MIEIKNLSKKYKTNEYYSVKDISISCGKGEIVGLVGSNGAGKSTILKSLVGCISFDSGDIFINGYDIVKKPVEAKKQFGYISDDHSVFESMTGIEYINFMADIYGVSREDRMQRLEALEKTFKMGARLRNLVSSYSFGMKQKICIMGVLIYQPDVWILDEPFTGLDATTTYEVEELMKSYSKKGKTVLFSSHDLHIVEKICNRIYIIKKGQLVEECEVKDFAANHDGMTLEEYFVNKIK